MRRHKWLSSCFIIGVIFVLALLSSGFMTSNEAMRLISPDRARNDWHVHTSSNHATVLQDLTGMDADSCHRWGVCAADLGIPFRLTGDEIGYAFGDTFETPAPESPNSFETWRSPVILRSPASPNYSGSMTFDGAMGIDQPGLAPEVTFNGHTNGEFSVIPNDALTLPNGEVVLSYMSIKSWQSSDTYGWVTNDAGLALSTDGGYHFDREAGPTWLNNESNTDPFQMQSMQLGNDGYVYMFSVAAGRQVGPMMLQRVPWQQLLDKASYQCWNGQGFGGSCEPLFTDSIGEPSVRLLRQGTHDVWVMSYLNAADGYIGTRFATSPSGPWSQPKVQITKEELPWLYGGFIDPRSTPEHLTLAVSAWQRDETGATTRYNVTLYGGDT